MLKKKEKNMGMATRLWGPFWWGTFHTASMGYPYNEATKKEKSYYKRFYKSIGDVLPCSLCKISYKHFLKDLPLTNKVLSSRKNLFVWTCKIHNKVNNKLSCKQITIKQMMKKYNFYDSFRASCSKDKLGCITTVKKNNRKTKIVYISIKNKKGKNIRLNFGKTKKINSVGKNRV